MMFKKFLFVFATFIAFFKPNYGYSLLISAANVAWTQESGASFLLFGLEAPFGQFHICDYVFQDTTNASLTASGVLQITPGSTGAFSATVASGNACTTSDNFTFLIQCASIVNLANNQVFFGYFQTTGVCG